jgi:hypothetical protein
MNSAERFADKHYAYFLECLGTGNLAIPYNIPSANIVLLKTNSYRYGLLWEYDDLPVTPALNLPEELCAHVMEYVGRRFSALFEFALPPDYPFIPPKWSFDSEINVLAPELVLGFQRVVVEHNCQNDEGWSPALKFEKDILNMCVRVAELI